MPNLKGIKIRGALPTWREKRDILADDAAPSAGLRALAEVLAGAGQIEEACDFYARAADAGDAAAREALGRVRQAAVESGDYFIWSRVCRHLGALPLPADEARALAAVAERAGKLFDARRAFEAIGDDAQVSALEARIPGALPVKPPEEEVADEVEAAEAAARAEDDAATAAEPDDDD